MPIIKISLTRDMFPAGAYDSIFSDGSAEEKYIVNVADWISRLYTETNLNLVSIANDTSLSSVTMRPKRFAAYLILSEKMDLRGTGKNYKNEVSNFINNNVSNNNNYKSS